MKKLKKEGLGRDAKAQEWPCKEAVFLEELSKTRGGGSALEIPYTKNSPCPHGCTQILYPSHVPGSFYCGAISFIDPQSGQGGSCLKEKNTGRDSRGGEHDFVGVSQETGGKGGC